MEPLARGILDFWFGELDQNGMASSAKQKTWFAKDPGFDASIKSRFGAYLETAAMGAYDRWALEPEGRVALIIMLDQFPRNLFRNQARAFYCDHKAMLMAHQGIEKAEYKSLPVSFAYFLLMPTMHVEDLAMQNLGVRCFTELCEQHEGPARALLTSALDYAKQHQKIIERFGRFPHRNISLGRSSTDEEIAFLKEPNSSF